MSEPASAQRVRSAVLALTTIVALSGAAPALGQETRSRAASCQYFRGEVDHARAFERSLESGVRFLLRPETAATGPPGWTIEITAPDSPSRDLSANATPPFRSPNPRVIGGAQGMSLAEAIAWSERGFQFVVSAADDEALASWVDTQVSPESYAEQTIAEVERAIDRIARGAGSLTILDARIVAGGPQRPERIDWMAFEALVCPPPRAGSWEVLRRDGLAGAEVRAIEVESTGAVWIGVRDRGLARLLEDRLDWFGSRQGFELAGVATLYADSRGRVWAGGPGGFAIRDDGGWRTYEQAGELRPRVVFDVHEDGQTGAMWIATSDGVARHDGTEWRAWSGDDGLPHPVVHAVAVGSDATIWFACRRGLGRLSSGRIETLLPDLNIRSALATGDGSLWFGTGSGIRRWDGADWTEHLPGRTIVPLLSTTSGDLWAGSLTSGLYRFADSRWEPMAMPVRLQGAEIFDLAAAPDGSIWIATSAGAARYDSSR